ncbi:hypothetical protein [Nocardia tengchongensis]|uniref:hypothetical protein n=1 Tax=Nocardia tengchongensis TaxID=2055889 RepID=UPI0036CF374C
MSLRDQFAQYLQGYEPGPEFDEVDNEPASSYLRAAMLDGLRKFEPAASLPGFADIRITGERYRDGLFDAHAAEIFTQLDLELRAAAPRGAADELSIGFREVRTGSVVLPLAPFGADGPAEGKLAVAGPSPLELALLRVVQLHDQVESETSEDWSADSVAKELAHRLRLLVDSLDKVDAGVEISLSQHDGRRRVSRLTGRGRQRVKRLFEPQGTVDVETKSGNLVGVQLGDEFAKVELQLGKRSTTIVEVPLNIAKLLQWDAFILIEVRTVKSSDRFGDRKRTVHQFLRVLEHADPLPDTDEGSTAIQLRERP